MCTSKQEFRTLSFDTVKEVVHTTRNGSCRTSGVCGTRVNVFICCHVAEEEGLRVDNGSGEET